MTHQPTDSDIVLLMNTDEGKRQVLEHIHFQRLQINEARAEAKRQRTMYEDLVEYKMKKFKEKY